MCRSSWFFSALVILSVLVGCQTHRDPGRAPGAPVAPLSPVRAGPRGAMVEDVIDLMDKAAATMNQVQDEASAKGTTANLERLADRMQKLAGHSRALGQASPEEVQQLARQYEARLDSVGKRFSAASHAMRSRVLEQRSVVLSPAVQSRLGSALVQFSKATGSFWEATGVPLPDNAGQAPALSQDRK